MGSKCQRCGDVRDSWQVAQARFEIGMLRPWLVMLCIPCTDAVEKALLVALKPGEDR